MDKQEKTTANDLGTLAEHASALMAATANVAGEQVSEARKRLASALASGKHFLVHVKDKAVEGAKATDKAVRGHPYAAIGIAMGAGALIGFLIARRFAHRSP
jgi:ElaB/YqjD/DUF883 family membrane-anchored ribosome-binding protein